MTPWIGREVVQDSISRLAIATLRCRWWQLVCCAVLLALAAGCGGAKPTAAEQELRIAVNPWPGYSFLFLADELGFFQQEGLQVRLIEFESLSDSRRVFEQGNADVIGCSLVEVLLMNDGQSGRQVDAFLACDYSSGSDMLLAREEIGSLAGLRGKKVGLEPDSLTGLCVHLALESAGLTLSDVTLVALAQSEMVAALKQHQVDAVQVYPPISDVIDREADVQRLWDSSNSPWAIVDVFAANKETIRVRQSQLQAFKRAFTRAQTYYEEHQSDAEAILSRRCRLSPEALRESLANIKILPSDPTTQRQLFTEGKMQAVAMQTAERLVAVGMLSQVPREPPLYFEGRQPSASAPRSASGVGSSGP